MIFNDLKELDIHRGYLGYTIGYVKILGGRAPLPRRLTPLVAIKSVQFFTVRLEIYHTQ